MPIFSSLTYTHIDVNAMTARDKLWRRLPFLVCMPGKEKIVLVYACVNLLCQLMDSGCMKEELLSLSFRWRENYLIARVLIKNPPPVSMEVVKMIHDELKLHINGVSERGCSDIT